VFRLKLNDLLKDVVKNQIFGKVLAYVQTTEVQKRGLPRAHMLFILSGDSTAGRRSIVWSVLSCRSKPYIHGCLS